MNSTLTHFGNLLSKGNSTSTANCCFLLPSIFEQFNINAGGSRKVKN